jgi:hypothetical protein
MAKLDENQKRIRKTAWGRLAFLKKFMKDVNYTDEQKLTYLETFRTMYQNSNLDEDGKKMADGKLDKIIKDFEETK